eukprot:TRINITY_DN5641_c0_g1_i3.p1 TRINITY_DN5641_c0_g1~~TRINITY_DN5641_c0_g1_i3.p1  ORF type:complete len:137 (+),score=24.87 TRINITY_DN5641_c0_g1_i3:567-977(+)
MTHVLNTVSNVQLALKALIVLFNYNPPLLSFSSAKVSLLVHIISSAALLLSFLRAPVYHTTFASKVVFAFTSVHLFVSIQKSWLPLKSSFVLIIGGLVVRLAMNWAKRQQDHPLGEDWSFKAVSYTHLTLPTIYSV